MENPVATFLFFIYFRNESIVRLSVELIHVGTGRLYHISVTRLVHRKNPLVGPPEFESGSQAPKARRMDQATPRPRSFSE